MNQILKFCKRYELYEFSELYENFKFTGHCAIVTRVNYMNPGLTHESEEVDYSHVGEKPRKLERFK